MRNLISVVLFGFAAVSFAQTSAKGLIDQRAFYFSAQLGKHVSGTIHDINAENEVFLDSDWGRNGNRKAHDKAKLSSVSLVDKANLKFKTNDQIIYPTAKGFFVGQAKEVFLNGMVRIMNEKGNEVFSRHAHVVKKYCSDLICAGKVLTIVKAGNPVQAKVIQAYQIVSTQQIAVVFGIENAKTVYEAKPTSDHEFSYETLVIAEDKTAEDKK